MAPKSVKRRAAIVVGDRTTRAQSTCEPMTDRKQHRRALENGCKLTKKKNAHVAVISPATTASRSNNFQVDEKERRLALQKASIALGTRATCILNAQSDPETLDLRPYAIELNDAMLNELASQLRASLKQIERAKQENQLLRQCQYYSTIVLSGCEKFTPVGIRAFIHAVGPAIRRLDFSKSIMSIDILKVMATGIEQLDTLDFSWCLQLKSECIHEFISCCNAQLTKLNMSNCPVLNDDALGWISGTLGPQGSLTQCRKLLSLDISYTKGISDRGLAALGYGCCSLQFINLEGLEKITNSGIQKLVQGCKSLRVLSLRKCMQLTDGSLSHIGEHCRQLRSLNVCGCFHLSSTGLFAMMRGTPLLQSLNLEGCLKMCEDILAGVATSCLSLQVLNLNGCQEITDNGIATLAEHLPFVQKARHYRGLEPKQDGLKLKFSIQQRTIYNSAALRIQAVYRGHVDRQIAASWRVKMIEMPACKTIWKSYVCWRLNSEINRRVKRTKLVNTSVIKIQALARGVLCRAALERASVEEERIKNWSKFAVKVQAVYRSHWTRKHHHVVFKTIDRYRKEQQLLQKHAAVIRLQRAYRARFHRSRLDDLMAINQQRRLERKNAAITLQRLFRSRAARKAYRALQAALEVQHTKVRELVRYAMKIQSRWRGHHARRQLARYQRDMQERKLRKYNAASRINAGVRGYFGRRVAQEVRVQFQMRLHAAKGIQRAWRRFKRPNAERINFENMLRQMKTRMFEESDAAMNKQAEILKKTRELIDRDSASELESDDDWRDFQDEYGDQFWFSPSRKQRHYVRPNENAFEKAMLGIYCRVFWPLEQQWFNGHIVRFNRMKNKHRVEYEDGDHEWLCFHLEGARIQLFNGYCWCMVAMFEPSLRTLRATTFLTLRFQRYDHRYLCWRSGVLKAYSETNDHFLVSYDDSAAAAGAGASADEWVDVFPNENFFQVQDAITLEWYSLSGYVFGHVRGRPLHIMTMAGGKAAEASFYGVEDYLSYVEEVVAAPESQTEETEGLGAEAESAEGGGGSGDEVVNQAAEESQIGVGDGDEDDEDADDEEEESEEEEDEDDGEDNDDEEESEGDDDGDREDEE